MCEAQDREPCRIGYDWKGKTTHQTAIAGDDDNKLCCDKLEICIIS